MVQALPTQKKQRPRGLPAPVKRLISAIDRARVLRPAPRNWLGMPKYGADAPEQLLIPLGSIAIFAFYVCIDAASRGQIELSVFAGLYTAISIFFLYVPWLDHDDDVYARLVSKKMQCHPSDIDWVEWCDRNYWHYSECERFLPKVGRFREEAFKEKFGLLEGAPNVKSIQSEHAFDPETAAALDRYDHLFRELREDRVVSSSLSFVHFKIGDLRKRIASRNPDQLPDSVHNQFLELVTTATTRMERLRKRLVEDDNDDLVSDIAALHWQVETRL